MSKNAVCLLPHTLPLWIARVQVDREKYLDLIDEGWPTLEEYGYQLDTTVIHVMQDGLSGQ